MAYRLLPILGSLLIASTSLIAPTSGAAISRYQPKNEPRQIGVGINLGILHPGDCSDGAIGVTAVLNVLDLVNVCVCVRVGEAGTGTACPACPANSSPSCSGGGCGCDCDSGFTKSGSVCVPTSCPTHSSLVGTQCVCDSGFQFQNGQCVSTTPTLPACKNGAVRASDGTCQCTVGLHVGLLGIDVDGCVNVCPLNAILTGGSCTCASGFELKNGQCSALPPSTPVTCASGATLAADGTCQCTVGLHIGLLGINVDGCVNVCPLNAILTGNSCACAPGFELKNGQCSALPPSTPTPTCGSGATLAADGTCQCTVGLHIGLLGINIDGCVNVCPLNAILTGNSCACAPGFELKNGQCSALPPSTPSCGNGATLAADGTCQCTVGLHIGLLGINIDGCVNICPLNTILTGNSCACAPGFELKNGQCSALPPSTPSCPNGASRASDGTCQCDVGLHVGLLGIDVDGCVNLCPLNALLLGGSCVCGSAFDLLYGACVPKCGPNASRKSDGTCGCLVGFTVGIGGIEVSGCVSVGPSARHRNRRTQGVMRNRELCPNNEVACPIFGHSFATGGYECLDTQASLESCGGCASLGEGQDCLAIPGAEGVGCSRGSCVIFSCSPGYFLADNECLKI